MKHQDVAIAIVFHDSKVLITRRKRGGVLGGFWEFPGGKVEAGESLQACVARELKEELAIVVQPVISLTPVEHQYSDRHITLFPFVCTHESGQPTPLASEEIRWVSPADLPRYHFPDANRLLIDQVIASCPASAPPIDPQKPAQTKKRHVAVVT